MTTTPAIKDVPYRGFTIRPAYRGVVVVLGPRGDDKGRFVSEAAAKTWIDALLGCAPKTVTQ